VIPSPSGDFEIGPDASFLLEAGFFEQADRAAVVLKARSLDAGEPEMDEPEPANRAHGFRHQPPTGMRRTHPVAQRRCPRGATADVAECEAAGQPAVQPEEHEKRISLVLLDLLGVTLHSAPI